MHFRKLRSLAAISLLLLANQLGAEDWPIYRGPNHDGVSRESGWLNSWSKPPKILWRAKVGLGHSSFSVSAGRVYTLGNSANQDTVFCFDAITGQELWKYRYAADKGARFYQGGTHSTPTVDQETGTVFIYGKQGQLNALDTAKGTVKWSRNVIRDLGLGRGDVGTWGLGGSPLVWDERLYLNAGSAGACLAKATGKVIWRSRGKSGFSTPLPYIWGNTRSLIFFAGRQVSGVNALTGRPHWTFPWTTQYDVNAADPVFLTPGKSLFVSSGYNVGGVTHLVHTGGAPRPTWRTKEMINHFNSCVFLDGHLYGIHGHAGKTRGELRCLDARNGRLQWSDRSVGIGSLMAADGKLIVISENGTLLIGEASPEEFKPTGRAQVMGPNCWAAPVLANGLVYVRNARGDVACVDLRSEDPQ
jgi:outer membrane protein assembly factor BamB